MIRIIVADHHAQTLYALRTILREQAGVELVGEAADAQALRMVAASHAADVVLVDRKLPGSSLTELVAELHAHEPRPFVIVMGSQSEYGRAALHAGADAFLSKSDNPEWLLDYLQSYAKRRRS